MVYVIPTSLVISPQNPNTSNKLIASVTIAQETLDRTCQFPYLWTKTYIRLLRKLPGQTWNNAQLVSTIDCNSSCCLDEADEINGTWSLTFDEMPAITTIGTYQYLAVDDSDWVAGNFDASITATRSIEVVHDPTDPCIINPCLPSCPSANTCLCDPTKCGGTSCASGDVICQIMKMVTDNPLIAIGGILVVGMILTGGRK